MLYFCVHKLVNQLLTFKYLPHENKILSITMLCNFGIV